MTTSQVYHRKHKRLITDTSVGQVTVTTETDGSTSHQQKKVHENSVKMKRLTNLDSAQVHRSLYDVVVVGEAKQFHGHRL